MSHIYDVIIIGSGPAGIFCARNIKTDNFLILDAGCSIEERSCASPNRCLNCDSCSVIFGVGGAGMFSDGKMNFSKLIGGNVSECFSDAAYDEINSEFIDSFDIRFEEKNSKKIREINDRFKNKGVYFLDVNQSHLGSDKLPSFISKLITDFKDKILCSYEITKVIFDPSEKLFLLKSKNDCFKAKRLIIATGQAGSRFAISVAKSFDVSVQQKFVDIGVRIETSKCSFDGISSIQYDPKIYINTSQGIVRTYCSNPAGFVIVEQKDNLVSVNGHAKKEEKTNSSNFALMLKTSQLSRDDLIQIIERMTSLLGHPLLQDVESFLSKKEPSNIDFSFLTCGNYKSANLWGYYPEFVCDSLREAIIKLTAVIPELKSNSSLIYAPEFKLYGNRILVQKNSFESSFKGLYFIGDCCGMIHGLVNAIYSGISCAKYINKELF